MKWYGRQPDSLKGQPAGGFDGRQEGGSAIMQAALAAEEAAGSEAALGDLLPAKPTLLLLMALCIAALYTCHRVTFTRSNGRRAPGIKGPGALTQRHAAAAQFGTRHGRNGTSWV